MGYIDSAPYVLERLGGSSSVAERQLPKLNVAGSIPVSRSKLLLSMGRPEDLETTKAASNRGLCRCGGRRYLTLAVWVLLLWLGSLCSSSASASGM